MDFYLIIKERRLLLGLTQQDLADYSGLSLRIVKSIENGKSNPSIMKTIAVVTEIYSLYNISLDRDSFVIYYVPIIRE